LNVRPTHADLRLIATATRQPRHLARVVAGAVVQGHEIDVEVRRDGPSYLVLLRLVAGERIVAESEWPVAWAEIDERARLDILGVYVAQRLQGHERWRRTTNGMLLALGVAPIASPSDE
jgi:hypothetical protein